MREFDAKYIIDGIAQDLTPRHFLTGELGGESCADCITDESVDPRLSPWEYKEQDIPSILEKMSSYPFPFSLRYPEFAARLSLATALIDSLWCEGHFSYESLSLSLKWQWNSDEMGAMAAFYRSCESLGEYLENLRIDSPELVFEKAPLCRIIATVLGGGKARKVPEYFLSEPASRLLYIPFDPCAYSLGGSALSKVCGNPGDAAVDISDGYYFTDCYEILREMVEDGVVMSAATVGAGGLTAALKRYYPSLSHHVDLSALLRAYGMSQQDETDRARVLFGEVPGVLLQIRESDYEYVDVQCLLQDVAYYSLAVSAAPLSALLQALMNR